MKKDALILSALTLVTLSSCSNDDEKLGSADPSNAISVATEVTAHKSRAGYTNENMREFGLIIAGSSDEYTYNNKRMTGGALEGWTTDETMYWESVNTPHCVIAYAPYREAALDQQSKIDVKVATDQSTAEAVTASDFIAMKNGAFTPATDLTDGNLLVKMNHMLSKVLVKLTYPEAYANADGANPVSGMSIEGMLVDATLDLAAWGGGAAGVALNGNGASEAITPFELNHDAATRTVTYEFIAVPQEQTTIGVKFNAGNIPYTWKYDNLKLQGGQALTINLSVDKQGVSLGGDVTVGEWEVGDEINGGNPSEGADPFTIADLANKTEWQWVYSSQSNCFWGNESGILHLWDGGDEVDRKTSWLSHQNVKGTAMAADYQPPFEGRYLDAFVVIDLGKIEWIAGFGAKTAGYGDTTFNLAEFYATDATEISNATLTDDEKSNLMHSSSFDSDTEGIKAVMDKVFAIDDQVTWTKIGTLDTAGNYTAWETYGKDFTDDELESAPVKTRYIKVVFTPYAYPQAVPYCERVSCSEIYLKHVTRRNGKPVE